MIDATAIIMTKNEEKNIVDCLKSMQGFAKRTVVIDCGSTDKTVELAKKYHADIYYHDFEYYAKQFNWGLKNCNIDTEWIIRLDADERFSKNLKREIEQIIKKNRNTEMNGITIEANFYFMGRCMKHGLRNKRKMMLFKREFGYIEDKRRDAHSVISRGFSVGTKERFEHYDFKDLDNYIKKYNWYATREMMDYMEYMHGKRDAQISDPEIRKQREKKYGTYYKTPRFIRAWLWFIYNYIFRLGFLDGKEGFLFHYFECYWYRLLVDAKIYEHEKFKNTLEALKALD